jgi:Uma2 family endonuclease
MSAMTQAGRRYTPEDLLRMPDGNRFELVDGELVEDVMSTWSSYVGGQLFARVNSHSLKNAQGWVFPEGTSYQCFPDDPKKVRRADVSFIRTERLSLAEATQEGHCPIAPDLAVEITSPNDTLYEVARKVREYLNAGVKLVWVVNPDVKTVEVHRADGTGVILTEKDQLSGEDVVPGLSCPIAELFVAPVK